MNKIRADAQKVQLIADDLKARMVALRGPADWDRLIRDLNEWKATAARLVPWVESVVKRFDAVLDQRDNSQTT